MNPITWRSVSSPNFAAINSILDSAQKSKSDAFDSLGKRFAAETQTNFNNWDNTKTNNTQEYLNELNQYRTPEELQAARTSGALDALRQRYGAQVDQAAIRTAEDGRDSILQQRALTGIDFKNRTTEDSLRPQIQQAEILAAKGDTSGLEALYGNNPTLRDFMGGKLTAAAITGQRAADQHTWLGNRDSREASKLADDLLTNAAQRRVLGAKAANLADGGDGEGGSGSGGKGGNFRGAGVMVDSSPLSSNDLRTDTGRKAFTESLTKLGHEPEFVSKALGKFLELSAKNGYADIPADVAIEQVVSTKDTSWLAPNNHIDNALARYSVAMSDPELMKKIDYGRAGQLHQATGGKGNSAPATQQKSTSETPKDKAPAKEAVAQTVPVTQPTGTVVRVLPPPTSKNEPANRLFLNFGNRKEPSVYVR